LTGDRFDCAARARFPLRRLGEGEKKSWKTPGPSPSLSVRYRSALGPVHTTGALVTLGAPRFMDAWSMSDFRREIRDGTPSRLGASGPRSCFFSSEAVAINCPFRLNDKMRLCVGLRWRRLSTATEINFHSSGDPGRREYAVLWKKTSVPAEQLR